MPATNPALILIASAMASFIFPPQPVGDSANQGLAQFVDGSWELRVDRTWRGSKDLSSDRVSEADYAPTPNGPRYPFVVSDGSTMVEVGGPPRFLVHPPVKGSCSSTLQRVECELRDGTFAGGRLVVWPKNQGLEAELTIYGSGVAIVSSARGLLVRKP